MKQSCSLRFGAAICLAPSMTPHYTWRREMPCPRTAGSGGAMTTVPPCDRGGLPWSRPRGDGMSAKPFRPTGDEPGRETWTSRRAVTNYMGYQSSFVATVTASGWYGRFSWLGPLNRPRSMCWTTRNFESSAETSKPGRTQGLFPVQKTPSPPFFPWSLLMIFGARVCEYCTCRL